MLCKAENRDPAHCLKEGRRVTRCATDLSVFPSATIFIILIKHWLFDLLRLLWFILQNHQDAGELLEGVWCSLGMSGKEQPGAQSAPISKSFHWLTCAFIWIFTGVLPVPKTRTYTQQMHVWETRACRRPLKYIEATDWFTYPLHVANCSSYFDLLM